MPKNAFGGQACLDPIYALQWGMAKMVRKFREVRQKVCNWFQYFARSYYQWQSFIPFSRLPFRVTIIFSCFRSQRHETFVGRVVGLFYRRLFYFRHRNQKRKFLISVHFRLANSLTHTDKHLMYVRTRLCVWMCRGGCAYADHMHKKSGRSGFGSKWKINKNPVTRTRMGGKKHSLYNKYASNSNDKSLQPSKKKHNANNKQKEIASKMF